MGDSDGRVVISFESSVWDEESLLLVPAGWVRKCFKRSSMWDEESLFLV